MSSAANELVWLTAIRAGDVDAVRALIESASAEPQRFANRTTALHWACEAGCAPMLQLMLDRPDVCGSVDEADSSGGTPLFWAASEGRVEACQMLLARGASLDVLDANGENCLHFAALSGHVDAARLLVERSPALINGLSLTGQTPLHLATINRHVLLVNMLIDRGADAQLAPPGGLSALQIAEAAQDADLLASFQPSTKRLFDKLLQVEQREKTLAQQLADANEKAAASAVKLRDLFRDFGELEAREKRATQLLVAAESAAERESAAAAERERALSEQLAVAVDKVEQLTKALAEASTRSELADAAAASSRAAAAVGAREVASLNVTLQQLNILLGLTAKGVTDTQAALNAVTAQIDRLPANDDIDGGFV